MGPSRRCRSYCARRCASARRTARVSGATCRRQWFGPFAEPQNEARRVTSFSFDAALRATIGVHLHSFDRRLRADAGALKRAAVAIVIVEAEVPGEAAFLLTRRTPKLRAQGRAGAPPGGPVQPAGTGEQTALARLQGRTW